MCLLLFLFFLPYLFFYIRIETLVVGNDRTPFYFLRIITVPVTTLYYFTSGYLNYHSLLLETVFYLLLGFVIFSIPGLLLLSQIKKRKTIRTLCGQNYINPIFLNRLALVLSIYMIYRANSIGFDSIFSEEASSLYGGKGLPGHILVFMTFLEAHFLITLKKGDWYRGLLIILMTICSWFYNVKIWIFTPYVIAFLVRSQYFGLKISWIKLFFLGAVIFGFFILSYLPTLGFKFDEYNWIFLVNHFTSYLFAGISGMNEAFIRHLPTGQDPAYGIPPFIDLIMNFSHKIDPNYEYLVVNDFSDDYTNVFGLIGSAFLMNGIVCGILYLFILSLSSYYFYFIQLRSCNYWYKLGYNFWCIGLFFSFFGNYYTLLGLYELSVISLIFGYIAKKNSCLGIKRINI